MNQWFARAEGPSTFQLYPSGAIWCFFPGFGAITIGWLITELLLPRFLGQDTAHLYMFWTNARAGMNSGKIFRWGTSLIAVPIGVLTVFAVPVHTTFHASEMRVWTYASMRSATYRYDQIRAITTTDGFRNRFGKFVSDPYILIDFDDGTRWSSGANLRDPDRIINVDLRMFLEAKSKLQSRHVPIERDLSTR